MRLRLLPALLALAACASEPRPDENGPFVPAHRTMRLSRGERTFAVEIWYPAADGVERARAPIEAYVTSPDRRAQYAQLLAASPDGCATRTLEAARDAEPAEGRWPLVVFSHCHGCTRFSSASLAEHLASHGFAVAAPDHEGNTLFDELAGDGLPLDATTLRLRADDVKQVLDVLLDGARTEVPEPLRGRFDPARVGAFGHSFGSVTTGLVTQEDARVKAAAGLAAPLENALLPGVSIASLRVPLFLLVAREDNSITELGNANIRDNFEKAAVPTWMVEVADAGHWSFSDVAGLREAFAPGCGTSKRQTDPSETFTYLPPAQGISIARAYLAAFFEAHLAGNAESAAFLDAPNADARVSVDSK